MKNFPNLQEEQRPYIGLINNNGYACLSCYFIANSPHEITEHMAVVHNAQQREHQIQNNDLQEPLSPKANEDLDVSSPMDHSPPRSRYDKLTYILCYS